MAAPAHSVVLDVDGAAVFVDVAPGATVSAADGTALSANQLPLGRLVRVYGIWRSSGHLLATHIDATPGASPDEAVSTPDKS
jgi:hypothetical protein